MAMIAKSKGNSGNFEIAPEGSGLAVCVDVTPLKTRETQFGTKEEFRLVFELDTSVFGTRKDGSPFCIWSRGFTLSLHEKAALTKFLEKWLGRSLSPAEKVDGFDVESLLGKCGSIIVEHDERESGTFANILSLKPTDKTLEASGNFVRECDRAPKDTTAPAASTSKPTYKKADKPAGAERAPWQKCKIHVGKYKGNDLGDLGEEDIVALYEKWLPKAKEQPKMTADDKRLANALEDAVNDPEFAKEETATATAF